FFPASGKPADTLLTFARHSSHPAVVVALRCPDSNRNDTTNSCGDASSAIAPINSPPGSREWARMRPWAAPQEALNVSCLNAHAAMRANGTWDCTTRIASEARVLATPA